MKEVEMFSHTQLRPDNITVLVGGRTGCIEHIFVVACWSST